MNQIWVNPASYLDRMYFFQVSDYRPLPAEPTDFIQVVFLAEAKSSVIEVYHYSSWVKLRISNAPISLKWFDTDCDWNFSVTTSDTKTLFLTDLYYCSYTTKTWVPIPLLIIFLRSLEWIKEDYGSNNIVLLCLKRLMIPRGAVKREKIVYNRNKCAQTWI